MTKETRRKLAGHFKQEFVMKAGKNVKNMNYNPNHPYVKEFENEDLPVYEKGKKEKK
jgi:hypothetical protein